MEKARKISKICFYISSLFAIIAGVLFAFKGDFTMAILSFVLAFVVTIMIDVLDIYHKLLEFYKLSEMQTECIKQMSLNQLGQAQALEQYTKVIDKKDKEIEKLKKQARISAKSHEEEFDRYEKEIEELKKKLGGK